MLVLEFPASPHAIGIRWPEDCGMLASATIAVRIKTRRITPLLCHARRFKIAVIFPATSPTASDTSHEVNLKI